VSRILIVEDEQDLANLLTYNLSAAGFETETSHSGRRRSVGPRRSSPTWCCWT
jgi:DNA-binding response OmpR family regulator